MGDVTTSQLVKMCEAMGVTPTEAIALLGKAEDAPGKAENFDIDPVDIEMEELYA